MSANTKDTATIAFRVDKVTKDEAEELFGQMGMTMGVALNMFLKQSVHEWKLPFQPDATRKFNRRLKKAYKESEKILSGKKKVKSYDSFQELWDDL